MTARPPIDPKRGWPGGRPRLVAVRDTPRDHSELINWRRSAVLVLVLVLVEGDGPNVVCAGSPVNSGRRRGEVAHGDGDDLGPEAA